MDAAGLKKNINYSVGKVLNVNTLVKKVTGLLTLILLTGLSFIIIYPFITKLSSAFKSVNDLYDTTVLLIPRFPTLDNIKALIEDGNYLPSFINTLIICLLCGTLQLLSCTLIGYGLAGFNFKGRKIILIIVMVTMFIPPQTIIISLFMKFRYFDIAGIFNSVFGAQINMIDTLWPSSLLSVFGLGFKNGLYILIMRQFFINVPKELEEAAEVDGSGVFRTFVQVNLPLAKNMLLTIFLFAFCWQYTDDFYNKIFFNKTAVLTRFIYTANTVTNTYDDPKIMETLTNTASILVILPLFIFYIFAQKYLIEGVESTGIKG